VDDFVNPTIDVEHVVWASNLLLATERLGKRSARSASC
jgi:hypothetical protein